MKIEKHKVVAIDYTLTGREKQVIDTSEGRGPLNYLHGSGNLISGLEKALDGKVSGDVLQVTIPPEEAYGFRDEKKVLEIPRDVFAKATTAEVSPGMQFQTRGPNGVELLTVIAVGEKSIRVDGNHPLAGETLSFDVTVREIRDATAEEMAHGHVHGPGGHHH